MCNIRFCIYSTVSAKLCVVVNEEWGAQKSRSRLENEGAFGYLTIVNQ